MARPCNTSFILHCYKHLLPTNVIEKTPSSEAMSSVSQEFRLILGNPNVSYRVLKNTPAVHILSQINPVHVFLFYFFKIHFNITLPSKSKSFKPSHSFRFPTKIVYAFFPLLRETCYDSLSLRDFSLPTLSTLTSRIPTKSTLYLANYLVNVVSDPDL